jgi:hypothetical protein
MTDDDDKFLERLRGDAAPLRYQVDEATLARIRARIHERIGGPQPGVVELLASWFRPLAAALSVVAVAAAITFATIDDTTPDPEVLEVVVAGEPYVVGD